MGWIDEALKTLEERDEARKIEQENTRFLFERHQQNVQVFLARLFSTVVADMGGLADKLGLSDGAILIVRESGYSVLVRLSLYGQFDARLALINGTLVCRVTDSKKEKPSEQKIELFKGEAPQDSETEIQRIMNTAFAGFVQRVYKAAQKYKSTRRRSAGNLSGALTRL